MLETLSLEYFVRTIAAILFVAALLFLVVGALKVRFKGKHTEKGGEIQVVQKMQIDTKHSITALEYDKRKFLLASGPGGLALVELQCVQPEKPNKFEQLLNKEIDNHGPQA